MENANVLHNKLWFKQGIYEKFNLNISMRLNQVFSTLMLSFWHNWRNLHELAIKINIIFLFTYFLKFIEVFCLNPTNLIICLFYWSNTLSYSDFFCWWFLWWIWWIWKKLFILKISPQWWLMRSEDCLSFVF